MLPHMRTLLVVLAFAVSQTGAWAQTPIDSCKAAWEDVPDTTIVDLFDPATPQPRRLRALDTYQRLAADSKCPGNGYQLGLLYRHGPDLPGNLLPRDVQRARQLILPHAEEGYLFGYADLAEMAMQQGQAREAMQWAQVYLSLMKRHGAKLDAEAGFDRRGYNVDLLIRAQRAWQKQRPALPKALILQDLRAYLEPREAGIVQALQERQQSQQTENQDDLSIRRRRSCSADLGRIPGGYAMYLLEVRPDGSVARVAIENFAPRPEVAAGLLHCARTFEFEPFTGNEPRIGRIPVVYGFADGPSIRR